jgi:excinuclease UvrABC nuclease subunit
MAEPKVTWLTHEFTVYPWNTTWNVVGGVYIFSYLLENKWRAVYIGIADSFLNRLSNHDRDQEAKRLGATHVHAMVVQQEATRLLIEKQLIAACQPPLNTHHK